MQNIVLSWAIPIALSYLDFDTKEAIVGKIMFPTENLDNDKREIMDFYRIKHIWANTPTDAPWMKDGRKQLVSFENFNPCEKK